MKKSLPNETLLTEVARLIAAGHTVTITVQGNSMNPFLVDGRDKITLGGFLPEQLQPGKAVLARDATGRFVFHRIIRRNVDRLWLQGDGNTAQVEETRVGEVAGVMTEAIRKGKHYPANGSVWRLYSCCWRMLTPVRRWPLALYRRIFLKNGKEKE